MYNKIHFYKTSEIYFIEHFTNDLINKFTPSNFTACFLLLIFVVYLYSMHVDLYIIWQVFKKLWATVGQNVIVSCRQREKLDYYRTYRCEINAYINIFAYKQNNENPIYTCINMYLELKWSYFIISSQEVKKKPKANKYKL